MHWQFYRLKSKGGHSHTREPVALHQMESIERIHEFFKGNQMMGLGTSPAEAEEKC